MKFIGIDIGTTSICGVAATENGVILDSVTLPNASFIQTEAEYERIQNPSVIIETVNSVLEKLGASDATAIGFSGQMHGILYTDSNGKAVSPLYIWQDERANLPFENGKTYAEAFGAFAGYGLATDFYNEVNALIPDSAVSLCTIADYAAMQICGLTKPVTHITNAASLGRFDIQKNCFNLDNPRLPEVTADFKIIGDCNGVPVSVALGDNQASFIGSVRNPENALVNVGTGAQISWLSSEPVDENGVETRPFDGKRFLAAGCSLCGGRAFAMFEKFLREAANLAGAQCDSFYPYLNKILEPEIRTDLKADCRFCGTRLDPSIRGSFSGISENNFTVADFAFAVLEGMAYELYSMYSPECKSESIVCSGNGMRKNAALRRIVSQMFESEIKVPFYEEEAAYGAALSAMTASGCCESIDAACAKIRYRGD